MPNMETLHNIIIQHTSMTLQLARVFAQSWIKQTNNSIVVWLTLATLCNITYAQAQNTNDNPDAQNSIQEFTDSAATEAANIMAMKDSVINEMMSEIQELKLQRILMQEELERTGLNAKQDSIAQAVRKQRIDSLRKVTAGAPLIIGKDTLFTLYARKGGMLPEARIREAKEEIEALGHKLTFSADSVYIYSGEEFTDIMVNDNVILSITDTDALWQDTDRDKLARTYAKIIEDKLVELNEEYGLRQKMMRILQALGIVIIQIIAISLTNTLFRRWRFRLTLKALRRLKSIKIKGYELLNIHKQGILFMNTYNYMRILFIFMQLFVTVPLIFSIFPETKTFTYTIIGYIWNPFKDIVAAFVAYLPNLFKIGVIYMCFRYMVRGIHYIALEIESERLKINGFYADWASPTYYILRVLLYSLMFVMIWPLLPNSNSEIFQGVSVFIGIIVSLGSTSIIGNIMAGMVMTYMRPFRIGDFIKVGDTEGEVIEKTMLVTRIRTRKNEVITIQNSSLMGSQTSNYTVAAKSYGIIVHTKVTIGYDVPWQTVRDIMEGAAIETQGISHHPKPFMRTTSLDDFYVEYEINAYTKDAKNLSRIYSDLHQNLLRGFFEADVEIMSPHIYARRDGIETQMPGEYLHSPGTAVPNNQDDTVIQKQTKG